MYGLIFDPELCHKLFLTTARYQFKIALKNSYKKLTTSHLDIVSFKRRSNSKMSLIFD